MKKAIISILIIAIFGTAFANRGIERHHQTRIAREQQAWVQRNQQPAQNYRVDNQKPAFRNRVPRLGGGGGAIDPVTGVLGIIITAAGAVRIVARRKKR